MFSPTATCSQLPRPSRVDTLDVGRGLLLVAMIGVHLLSAHGASAEVGWMRDWVGVFLISSGFVGLSGYVQGMKPGPPTRADWLKALDTAGRLLLVMFGYGLLVSLTRHGLRWLSGGGEQCLAQEGWLPPLRFDDLGILLPIALVQLMVPLARLRRRGVVPALWLLATIFMWLPSLTKGMPASGVWGAILGVLTQRTLTPFYTISFYLGIGLVCTLLGRLGWPVASSTRAPGWLRGSAAALAVVLAAPRFSEPVLTTFRESTGHLGGGALALAYRLLNIGLLLYACAPALDGHRTSLRSHLALLGRNSLWVFVLHDFLLELNRAGVLALGLSKGIWLVFALMAADLPLLWLAARVVEQRERVRALARLLLLTAGPPQPVSFLRRVGSSLSMQGLLLAVIVVSVYGGNAQASQASHTRIDDFERGSCPAWWTFGDLQTAIVPHASDRAGHYLRVAGKTKQPFGNGRGLFLHHDVSGHRALSLEVRGYGPGSGRLKIELNEDDNQNWEIEKDPTTYVPLYDDRHAREIRIDWEGWRTLHLPLSSFQDDNPGHGNDRFDPQRDLTSGGLLELQLLFLPNGEGREVRFDLDDLRWLP